MEQGEGMGIGGGSGDCHGEGMGIQGEGLGVEGDGLAATTLLERRSKVFFQLTLKHFDK